MNDQISNFITKIRNGLMIRSEFITFPYFKILVDITKILYAQGFIKAYLVKDNQIQVFLKYNAYGDPVIQSISRVSKPGCRIYYSAAKLKSQQQFTIITTSKGVMDSLSAVKHNHGGEVLIKVT